MVQKPKSKTKTSGKGAKTEVFKTYIDVEKRYFPKMHEQAKQERQRRQPAVYGTGIALDVFEEARRQIR